MLFPRAGRLLISRHGQTDFNAGARYQGQIDAALSPLGREQALSLGRRLADEPIDRAYASDLLRAADTARIALGVRAAAAVRSAPGERPADTAPVALGERPVELQLDARLRELSFGRWEGLTFAEIQQRFPEDVTARERDRVHFAPPGGESLVHLQTRVASFLQDVLPRVEDASVLIVAHGGSVNALISTLIGIPLTAWWRLRNNNANLSCITFSETGPRLAAFNDTCHLAGMAELKWP